MAIIGAILGGIVGLIIGVGLPLIYVTFVEPLPENTRENWDHPFREDRIPLFVFTFMFLGGMVGHGITGI